SAPAAASVFSSAPSTRSPSKRHCGGTPSTPTTLATSGCASWPAWWAPRSPAPPLAAAEQVRGAHPGELAGVRRVVDRVGGEARAVGDADDEGGEHGGEPGPQHGVDVGARVGDLRGDGPQHCGKLPDGGFDQVGRVKPEPVGRVTEDPVIGLYPGHAVLVDSEEQGVLAWRTVVD